MPPILGTLFLLIVRVDNKPILKVDEAFKNVPWGSLMMCAATLVLGVALTHDAIGIKAFLETNLNQSLINIAPIGLLIIFGMWAAIQTNISSNMVTATLVASVAFSVLTGINSSLNLNAVVCIIGLLASFAFATPPSMPHIAIIAGSDECNVKDVLIFGSILMVISVIVALGVGYPLGSLFL
jgi:sodium-dependent dicarboxylate transporter 2/3/5